MSKKTLIIIGAVFLVIVVLGYLFMVSTKPTQLDSFASCLGEKGLKFYGAFWCPHCQAQKALFGSAAEKLPYIECSSKDGKTQLPICNEKNISTYPTWFFPDGSSESGELTLEKLSEKSSCPLPN